MTSITIESHPNIALVKYWGQRNSDLYFPYNSSISITLNSNLWTRTSVYTDKQLKKDEAYLNGEKVTGKKLTRVLRQINYLRKNGHLSKNDKLRIASINNFPTSAGIASSASGFSALALALYKLFDLDLSINELSILARIGSGSAARSIYGGFVLWHRGELEDGSDSYAVQVKKEDYWPELRDLIVITEEKAKKVNSAEGMQRCVQTSPSFMHRIAEAEARVEKVKNAILEKDFETIAIETMHDSDRMHSIITEATPQFSYLNAASHNVINTIKAFNSNSIKAAYTFDAGPNAHIITLQKHAKNLKEILQKIKGVKEIIEAKVGSAPKVVKKGALIDKKGKLL